ncbi:MAG: ATP-grasp domain-containing protein, partial [Bacteroidales bacterium]|nr:ATP-grasp domain-containing protein [Bacteroidales bacterium]
MKKQKLAIIGASYLQMPLVLKAKELGIETHCFAWEEGAVCKPFVDVFYPISTIDKQKILEICEQVQIDGITSIASDVAVPTINFIAHNLGLIGNQPADTLACTNKFLMRERFKHQDVSSPMFCKIGKADAFSFIESFKFPLIAKPVDRSGSRGVEKVNSRNELKKAIKRAQKESFANECIVEEYIDGVEVSVESISWEGIHYVLAITDKETTGAPYFVELAHHQPSLLDGNIQNKIILETKKALDALNIKFGASHSEFKITNDGEVYVIEIGARMGGDFIGSDLVYLSTGYDFLKGVIEIALGNFITPILNQKKYSGVYFLSKERENLKTFIENKSEYYIK